MRKTFKAEFLKEELDLPSDALEDNIIGQGRWTTRHEIIFKYDEKFYRTHYSKGSTERQDESPWEYDNEVECYEVHQVEKMIKVWENVNN